MKCISGSRMPKVLTLLLCFFFIFNSCSKKGGGGTDGPDEPEPIPTGVLTADRTTYTQYQMMVFQIKKSTQTVGQKIKVTIGTKEADAVVLSDSSVLLIAPDGLAGNDLPVNFLLKNVQYKGAISIQAAAAAGDPDIYFNGFTQDISASLDMLKSQVEADTSLTERSDIYDAISASKDSIAAFKTAYARLQPAEKAYLANFIKANFNNRPKFPESLKYYTFGRKAPGQGGIFLDESLCNTADPLWNYQCATNKFIVSLAEMSAWMVLTYASAVPIQIAFPGLGTALATITTVTMVYEMNNVVVFGKKVITTKAVRAWNAGVKLYESASEYFKTVPVSGSTSEFKNDAKSSFSFWSKFRNVQTTDNTSSIPFLENAISKINTFNSLAGKMSDKLKVNFSSLGSIFRKPSNINQLSVEVVSNQKVVLKDFSGTPDKLDLSFTTTETTDQDFEYDIIYKSAIYDQVKVRYKAKLTQSLYKVAYRENSRAVEGDVIFFNNIMKELKLVNNNGQAATGLDYSQIIISNNTNPKITVNKTVLPQSAGFGITLSTTQTTAEKTSFDVYYGVKKIQTITGETHDSVRLYKEKAVGTWSCQWYGTDGAGELDEYILTADGSGYRSSTSSGPIKPWDWYNTVTWKLKQVDKEYIISITYDNRNLGFGGPLQYSTFTFRNQTGRDPVPYVVFQKK